MLPTKTNTEINMKPYTHFTLNERKYIQESLETGDSIRKIAKALRRSPSTISREIKRNWSKKPNHYHHWAAQIKYWERRKSCHRKNNLLKDNAAYAFALEKLHQFWSPEIIAGNWNLNQLFLNWLLICPNDKYLRMNKICIFFSECAGPNAEKLFNMTVQ